MNLTLPLFNTNSYNPCNYYFFRNSFTKEEINDLEKHLESIQLDTGFVESTSSDFKTIRSSKIKWIPKEEEFLWVYNRIGDLAVAANKEMWNFSLPGITDYIQYTTYSAEEEGKYDWHLDIGTGPASFRKVSITIQISDPEEYEGGLLELNVGTDIITIPKEYGLVTIFPSYLLHRVTPVIRGIRKSLVLWIGGDQFR